MTTLEQSKKLAEIGLDPNTADMVYFIHHNNEFDQELAWDTVERDFRDNWEPIWDTWDEDCIPCWSMSSLMAMLPQHVQNKYNVRYVHNVYFTIFNDDGTVIFGDNIHTETGDTTMDAVVKFFYWLIENGHLTQFMRKDESKEIEPNNED